MIGQTRQQQSEFVAPNPCQRVFLADAGVETLPHELQDDVAHVVAMGVVHALEAVQVHDQDRKHRAVSPGEERRMIEAIGEQRPIRQSGERIPVGQEGKLLPRAVLLGDIPGECDHSRLAIQHRVLQA